MSYVIYCAAYGTESLSFLSSLPSCGASRASWNRNWSNENGSHGQKRVFFDAIFKVIILFMTFLFLLLGKVVIDAFRLINPNMMVLGQEPRQTTSVLGHLQKPSIQALIHGLNRHYYSIAINYRKNELEQRMLMNLNKKSWMDGLTLHDYNEHCQLNKVR